MQLHLMHEGMGVPRLALNLMGEGMSQLLQQPLNRLLLLRTHGRCTLRKTHARILRVCRILVLAMYLRLRRKIAEVMQLCHKCNRSTRCHIHKRNLRRKHKFRNRVMLLPMSRATRSPLPHLRIHSRARVRVRPKHTCHPLKRTRSRHHIRMGESTHTHLHLHLHPRQSNRAVIRTRICMCVGIRLARGSNINIISNRYRIRMIPRPRPRRTGRGIVGDRLCSTNLKLKLKATLGTNHKHRYKYRLGQRQPTNAIVAQAVQVVQELSHVLWK
jgi:hypothetical protein